MKTKFVKVSVSERLPTIDKVYVCIWLDCNKDEIIDKARYFMGSDNNRFFSHSQPSFWLEEVPDREDEMREMLEKIIYAQFTSGVPLSSLNAEISNARDYLKQLKN